jgi:hypothetical protein
MKTKSIKSIKLITYIVKNQVIDIPEGTIFNLEEVDGVDYFIKEDDPDVILSYQIAIQNPEYFEDWNFTRKRSLQKLIGMNLLMLLIVDIE